MDRVVFVAKPSGVDERGKKELLVGAPALREQGVDTPIKLNGFFDKATICCEGFRK